MLNKCIFCRFTDDPNLISNQLIINTEKSFVMLSANPQTKGHALVIPKAHFNRLADIPTNLQGQLFSQAVKVGENLKSLLKAKAYVIKVNNELYKLEGSDKQHVGHIHFHVIPRYKSGEKLLDKPKAVSSKMLKLVQSKITDF